MNKFCMRCGSPFQGIGDICPKCSIKESAPTITSTTSTTYNKDNGLFQKYFRVSNRINRFQFFIRTSSLFIFNIIVLLVYDYIQKNNLNLGISLENTNLAILILFVLSLISFITLMIRRLHDSETSSIWIVLSWIIPFCFLWLLYKLYFSAGTNGENKYGGKPI